MKIRAFRKLLDAVENMEEAVVVNGALVSPDAYKAYIIEMANDPDRLEQFRLALIEAGKSVNEIDDFHI